MHTKENWFLFSVSRCVIELLCDLKAKQLGTKQLDEDSLFQLIESLPAKKSKYEVLAEKEAAKVTLLNDCVLQTFAIMMAVFIV